MSTAKSIISFFFEHNLPKPKVDYQKYMGGVDLSDQLIKTFSVVRKSRKAWKKLFGYGLEVCFLYSFIIMRKTNPQSSQEFIQFRLEVAHQLIGHRSFQRKAGRPTSLPLSKTDEKRLEDRRHALEVTDSRRDCAVCAKRAIMEDLGKNFRYKSCVVCVTCNRTPLCIKTETVGKSGITCLLAVIMTCGHLFSVDFEKCKHVFCSILNPESLVFVPLSSK